MCLLSGFQLVGDPGPAVLGIDRAAGAEAVLFQQVLHDMVVGVGVRPQVGAEGAAEGQAPAEEAGKGPIAACPVDGGIGPVVEPLAVFNDPVGGIIPRNTDKYAVDCAAFFLYITVSRGDIAGNHRVRIARLPLGGISGFDHKSLGGGQNRQNLFQVLRDRFADHGEDFLTAGA